MKNSLKNGYYTEPDTNNTIAIIDNAAYVVVVVDNKKIVKNCKLLLNK